MSEGDSSHSSADGGLEEQLYKEVESQLLSIFIPLLFFTRLPTFLTQIAPFPLASKQKSDCFPSTRPRPKTIIPLIHLLILPRGCRLSVFYSQLLDPVVRHLQYHKHACHTVSLSIERSCHSHLNAEQISVLHSSESGSTSPVQPHFSVPD